MIARVLMTIFGALVIGLIFGLAGSSVGISTTAIAIAAGLAGGGWYMLVRKLAKDW